MDERNLVGQRIKSYLVTKHIGRGGMADVYLANEEALARQVALKVLLPYYSQHEEFKTRFTREAQTAANLVHTNIIRVFATGVTPNGDPFIAMEYCQRGTLNQWLNQLESKNKILPAVQALALVRQIADALTVAHQAGIVHRDLKPSNILIREDGTPVLADLGIAAVPAATRLTQTGSLMGTPHYMSPEQAAGVPVDGRSDIYSLGIILYELLAGIRPFDGEESLAVLHKQLYEKPPPLQNSRSDLSHHTFQVVNRCLQKKPKDRYQSALEMVVAVDRAIADEDAKALSIGSGLWLLPLVDQNLPNRGESLRKPMAAGLKNQPRWLYAVGGIILLLIVGYFLFRAGERGPFSSGPIIEDAKVAEASESTAIINVGENTPIPSPPTATIAPTRTETPVPPTDEPTITPRPTNTPRPTETPAKPATATRVPATLTPRPAACSTSPIQAFAGIWASESTTLGCPTSSGQSGVAMAAEDFQGGRMVWRGNNRVIYVIYNSGQWAQYNDTWREGNPTFTCGGPDSPPDPLRGFGKVWCTNNNVRLGMGPAINGEWADSGTTQNFQNGIIIRLSSGRTYIMFGNGRWQG